ncbi:MAG TPA: ATP-binding protein [Mycobacteriales bacterium]|nr:ATP-binding protein [Mycobacteriales bacterium]
MTKSDISRIERLLWEAVPTLLIQTRNGGYDYDVVNGRALRVRTPPSMSTNSMVAHALACLAGRIPESLLVGCRISAADGLVSPGHHRCMDATVALIVTRIADQSGPGGPFDSPAFGNQDPFTMGWLVELLRYSDTLSGAPMAEAWRILRNTAEARVRAAFKDLDQPFLLMPLDEDGEPKETAMPHPLPLLRLVELAQLLEIADDDILSAAFGWFNRRIEQQQARRGSEHSYFDVAELVFCLEGMLVAAPGRVSRPVIDGVLAAVEQSRHLNRTLRPTTPFKVTRSGGVHLFVSVEVVASLLRTGAELDRMGDPGFFAALKPILHDYLSWLQATAVAGKAKPGDPSGRDYYPADTRLDFVGWQSEHVRTDDGTVNLWLTSQVILLLCAYHTQLSRDLARRALDNVGLPAHLGRTAARTDSTARRAEAISADPLALAEDSPYRTASKLEELFVGPRLSGKLADASYSCLLYGPPGTGKTTLARRVATDLGWPLVTITTTDFMLDGENGVEARAKAIFEALGEQTDTVIFFDEIDRLVLDRDAETYTRQGDMLQFMTPSMLTKLNDLRARERSIVMIGTNYADRIDSAIKRAGRIDHRLLVLPPGLERRRAILVEALERWSPGRPAPEEELADAALAGAWRTVAELRAAARNFAKSGGLLADRVVEVLPAVSIRKAPLLPVPAAGGVWSELDEEAFLLIYLYMEGRSGLLPAEYRYLADRWAAMAWPERFIRDPQVVTVLNEIFNRA